MSDVVSKEEFDDALYALLREATNDDLMAVSGLYELLAEEWHNEAISRALERREYLEDRDNG